ncbi:hypothetical protein Pan2_82 [Pseudanabaena phage Pan2]|nr:hypothetical protein Pan2_82 [Pseudanabaena phage Pan2]
MYFGMWFEVILLRKFSGKAKNEVVYIFAPGCRDM